MFVQADRGHIFVAISLDEAEHIRGIMHHRMQGRGNATPSPRAPFRVPKQVRRRFRASARLPSRAIPIDILIAATRTRRRGGRSPAGRQDGWCAQQRRRTLQRTQGRTPARAGSAGFSGCDRAGVVPGSDCCVALRFMLPSSAGATSIMLDESFGFKAAPSLQQRSSDLTYKFIDSESYFLEGDVTVLVRSLQPNPEADRIAFFNEARRCRARACLRLGGVLVLSACACSRAGARVCLRPQPLSS